MILTNKKANSICLAESMRVTANVLCEISVYNVHFNDKIKLVCIGRSDVARNKTACRRM